MSDPCAIDALWRRDHPLPAISSGLDKDARGRVLLVGGSAFVPGAVRLTAEAVLRAGAGKVQLATVAAHVVALGTLIPEVAMIALPADEEGEIALAAADALVPRLERCETLVLGCGMQEQDHTPALLARLLKDVKASGTVVIDAGMLTAAADPDAAQTVAALDGRAIMTPHPGELAALTGEEREAVEHDPADAARRAAARFGAIIVLKSETTVIASPAGELLTHVSDSPGLGTAGSGDVLAGVIGGLLARGAPPIEAAAWGVWLHGQAGATLAAGLSPLGFLARELLPAIPGLMAAQSQR